MTTKPRFQIGDKVRHIRAALLSSGKISIIYTDHTDRGRGYTEAYDKTRTGPHYVVDWATNRTDYPFSESELTNE